MKTWPLRSLRSILSEKSNQKYVAVRNMPTVASNTSEMVHPFTAVSKTRRTRERGGAWYAEIRFFLSQPFGGVFERLLLVWIEFGIERDGCGLGEGLVFAGCPVKFYIV